MQCSIVSSQVLKNLIEQVFRTKLSGPSSTAKRSIMFGIKIERV